MDLDKNWHGHASVIIEELCKRSMQYLKGHTSRIRSKLAKSGLVFFLPNLWVKLGQCSWVKVSRCPWLKVDTLRKILPTWIWTKIGMDIRIRPLNSWAKGFPHSWSSFWPKAAQSPFLDLDLFRRPPIPELLQHILRKICPTRIWTKIGKDLRIWLTNSCAKGFWHFRNGF